MARKKNYISTVDAKQIADKQGISITIPTIIAHMQYYGHQIGSKGSKWVVDEHLFRRFLSGKKIEPSSKTN